MSCSKELTNFMIRCQNRHGFPLPAIYSEFVGQGTDIDTINEILKVNNLNMIHGTMNPIKYFLTFLIEFKSEIEKVLGGGYYTDVFILLITWKSGRITNIVFSFISVVMTCLEFQLTTGLLLLI